MLPNALPLVCVVPVRPYNGVEFKNTVTLVYKATTPCYIKRHGLLLETSMMIKVI